MLEISVINKDGKVIWDNNFKKYNEYLLKLKDKTPDTNKMREMEVKFLNLVRKDRVVANYYKIAIGVSTSVLTSTTYAYADTLGGVSERLRVIVNPVIELLAGIGYPITYGMLITGFIMIIMGKKSKGLEIIKWACMGYIGLQFVPFILGILEMIGSELRKSL